MDAAAPSATDATPPVAAEPQAPPALPGPTSDPAPAAASTGGNGDAPTTNANSASDSQPQPDATPSLVAAAVPTSDGLSAPATTTSDAAVPNTSDPASPPPPAVPAPAPAQPPAPRLYPDGVNVADNQKHLYAKAKATFAVFDKAKSGSCDIRETGTILRAVGVYPSEAKLKELVLQIMDQAMPTSMSFDRFIQVTWPLIANKQMTRDEDDLLYRAFLALDKDRRGFIDVEYLKQMLKSMGEPMSNEEMDEMIATVATKDGQFPYEDYLALIE